MKRCVSALCCLVLLGSFIFALPAGAAGYRNNRLGIISEPEAFSSEDVTYYIGENKVPSSKMVWVENGYEGKALKLSGKGEFLRLAYTTVRVAAFTFSAWVNWQGEASGERLFNISRGTTNYLTFSPYMYDPDTVAEGGCLNGLYLGYQYGGTQGKVVDMFTPAAPGNVTYALPRDEWHHVAVVSDARTLKVYIDGVLWLEEQVLTSLAELQANSLDIGTGEWGDPTLNALLDNVEIYRSALTAEKIRELAGAAAGDVYLPTAPSVTTTVPTTTTTTVATTTARQTLGTTLWGMPMWGIYTIAGVIAAYIAVTVVANILQKRSRKKEGDDTECGND